MKKSTKTFCKTDSESKMFENLKMFKKKSNLLEKDTAVHEKTIETVN